MSWDTLNNCRLQGNYDSECKMLTTINLLRSNTYDFTRKKISFFYIHKPSNTILRFFEREKCKWFRFMYMYMYNIENLKHNDLNGTNLKILTFTRKTHFHELRNTE